MTYNAAMWTPVLRKYGIRFDGSPVAPHASVMASGFIATASVRAALVQEIEALRNAVIRVEGDDALARVLSAHDGTIDPTRYRERARQINAAIEAPPGWSDLTGRTIDDLVLERDVLASGMPQAAALFDLAQRLIAHDCDALDEDALDEAIERVDVKAYVSRATLLACRGR